MFDSLKVTELAVCSYLDSVNSGSVDGDGTSNEIAVAPDDVLNAIFLWKVGAVVFQMNDDLSAFLNWRVFGQLVSARSVDKCLRI